MASNVSIRKYYSVKDNQQSRVLMGVRTELEVANLSANALGVHEIYHVDYSKWFILLEDFW